MSAYFRASFRGMLTAMALACPCTPSIAADVIVGPARVVDGDTIQLGDARVRLEGIDAPEAKQTCINANGREWPCGRAASRELQKLVSRRQVRCEAEARDDYGRLIGTCSVGDL